MGGNSTLTISNNTILHGFNKQLTNAGNIITSQGANNVLFKNLALSNYEGTISLSHCVFDTCGTINTEDGPFSITNSTFNQTSIYAHAYELPRNPYNVVILNDTFNIASNTNAIIIKDIPQCNVTGNTIATGGDGIFLWGLSGVYADYVVNNNNISNCGGSGS